MSDYLLTCATPGCGNTFLPDQGTAVVKPYLQDADFTLYNGDVREVLRELPAESVDCALTSPPFFGLRDYGTGQWEGGDRGCDHTPPPTRFSPTSTLKNDGRPNPGAKNYELQTPTPYAGTCRKCGARRVDRQIGLEATPDEWVAELVGVFREVRRVLRPAGTLWIECGDSYAQIDGTSYAGDTREPGQNGVFNVAPSLSATPRSRKSRVPDGYKRKDLLGSPWMLAFALRADGWYLRQCLIWQKPNAMPESVRDRCTTSHSYVLLLAKNPRYWFDADAIAEPYQGFDGRKVTAITNNAHRTHENYSNREGNDRWPTGPDGNRNARSVWSIPTQGYAEAHFATWPEALVERIIKAGCPEGGTVFDPFMGSGTTALVARRLGRLSVGVELNPDYCAMAARRLSQLSLLAEAARHEAP